jgi:FXSXX-COOH protein
MPHSVEEPGDRAPSDVLPEVGSVPLAEFLIADDSVLARAVLRVLHDVGEPEQNYAAFGNAP